MDKNQVKFTSESFYSNWKIALQMYSTQYPLLHLKVTVAAVNAATLSHLRRQISGYISLQPGNAYMP